MSIQEVCEGELLEAALVEEGERQRAELGWGRS